MAPAVTLEQRKRLMVAKQAIKDRKVGFLNFFFFFFSSLFTLSLCIALSNSLVCFAPSLSLVLLLSHSSFRPSLSASCPLLALSLSLSPPIAPLSCFFFGPAISPPHTNVLPHPLHASTLTLWARDGEQSWMGGGQPRTPEEVRALYVLLYGARLLGTDAFVLGNQAWEAHLKARQVLLPSTLRLATHAVLLQRIAIPCQRAFLRTVSSCPVPYGPPAAKPCPGVLRYHVRAYWVPVPCARGTDGACGGVRF